MNSYCLTIKVRSKNEALLNNLLVTVETLNDKINEDYDDLILDADMWENIQIDKKIKRINNRNNRIAKRWNKK